ncbi:ArfGap-domain-containing protein [Panus rudis PR-1116 ss-1]|nr:ArfGap-domain-containing protein [Panus rudis PR-1116 ss-1]
MSVSKIAADRNQKELLQLAQLPGNDICADCKARNPRWASYNLGIFICMSCASIHRKIGTHITKVKSLVMDTWTKEQVEHMRQMGNIKSNAIYNPDEIKHPPPPNMIDSERDSDLEKYIRNKYEYKAYFNRSALVASKLGPSRSAASRLSQSPQPSPRIQSKPTDTTSRTAPSNVSTSSTNATNGPQPVNTSQAPVTTPVNPALTAAKAPFRSVSQPVPSSSTTQIQPPAQPASQPQATPNTPSTPLWNDLISLQTPASNASLPLQYAPPQLNTQSISATQPISIPNTQSQLNVTNPYSNLSASPLTPFPSSFNQPTGIFPGGINRSMSLNTGLSAQMNTGLSISPNFAAGGASPLLQQSHLSGMTPNTSTPSPNPFAPQALPQMQSPSPYGTMGSYSQQQYNQYQTPQMTPTFQPQPITPQFQTTGPTNPFMQMQQQQPSPSPQLQQLQTGFSSNSPYGTPSPMLGTQPMPQMGMQMQTQFQQPQQQQFSGAGQNQFTSWMQTPGPHQQQWGM